jgi:hypothetical protein
MHSLRCHLRCAVACALLLLAFAARAEPDPPSAAPELDRCVTAHLQGQELRLESRLLDAQRAFHQCSAPSCPELVRADCAQWADELERALPRIVLHMPQGLAPERLTVTGNAQPLIVADGQPVRVDPGPLLLEVRADGYVPFRVQLEIEPTVEPQHVNVQLVQLNSPAAPGSAAGAVAAPKRPVQRKPAPRKPAWQDPAGQNPEARGVPTPTLAFGAAALATGAAAAYLGWSSRDERERLASSCAPLCSDAEVNRLRLRALGADIGWVLSLASATAAILTYAAEPRERDDRTRTSGTRTPKRKPALTNWSVAVGKRGLGASFGRSF